MQEVLPARYYNIHENEQKRYLIQTKSQEKTRGTVLPIGHGIDNNHMFPLSQKTNIMLNQD